MALMKTAPAAPPRIPNRMKRPISKNLQSDRYGTWNNTILPVPYGLRHFNDMAAACKIILDQGYIYKG